MTRMVRRIISLTSALSLLLCLTVALVSFRVFFVVSWRGETVGASHGIALLGHYKVRHGPRALHRWPEV